ncbi:hypothetical protein O3P69_010909, partial [Scylla paramamosain]
ECEAATPAPSGDSTPQPSRSPSPTRSFSPSPSPPAPTLTLTQHTLPEETDSSLPREVTTSSVANDESESTAHMEQHRSTPRRGYTPTNSELRVVSANLRGFHTNVGELTRSVINKNNVDLVFVCETFLDDKVPSTYACVRGYSTWIRKDRSTQGGGVAFCHKETLNVQVVEPPIPVPRELELIALKSDEFKFSGHWYRRLHHLDVESLFMTERYTATLCTSVFSNPGGVASDTGIGTGHFIIEECLTHKH